MDVSDKTTYEWVAGLMTMHWVTSAFRLLRAQIPSDSREPVHQISPDLGNGIFLVSKMAANWSRYLNQLQVLNFWWTDKHDIWMKHTTVECTTSKKHWKRTTALKGAAAAFCKSPLLSQNTETDEVTSQLFSRVFPSLLTMKTTLLLHTQQPWRSQKKKKSQRGK